MKLEFCLIFVYSPWSEIYVLLIYNNYVIAYLNRNYEWFEQENGTLESK